MNLVQASRFKDAPWFPKKEVYCIVGGAGGIGSWLSLMLARAGYKPIVYDFDIVEEHNIGGQLFSKDSVNKSKVAALKEVVYSFSGEDMTANNERYTKDSMTHHYMFSAFDNMQARKDMFESWVAYVEEWKEIQNVDNVASEDESVDTGVPVFIDGRLLMEQLTIFCVTPDKIDEYRKHLFDDSEVAPEPCTLKQTSHSAAMIASHMVGFFTNHYGNNVVGDDDRTVPFKWEYFIPINYINEE